MALEISSPKHTVLIETEDEVLFSMLDEFGIDAPQLKMIWSNFYSDPNISSSGQVRKLMEEIDQLRSAYISKKSAQLIREKQIHAKNQGVIDQIVRPMLENDGLKKTLDEFYMVCEDAVAADQGLDCSSD